MKKVMCCATAVLLFSISIQALAQEEIQISGEHTQGVRKIDLNRNSSKFNEYRDLRDGYYIYDFRLNALDTGSGRYLDFKGENLLRDDQHILVRLDDFNGGWNLMIDHNQTPHRLSNKAMSPYVYRGGGLFTIPGKVPIIKDGNDATGTPSLVPTTSQMAINDALIAKYLETHLQPTIQGIRRDRTVATLNLQAIESLNFRLRYLHEQKDGTGNTYGPIGDRPPRTVNAQLPEPVDHTTREIHANAEYVGNGFQAQLRYLFSLFENNVRSLRWENMYFTPDAGVDFISTVPGTARNVSGFGQRSLAPDNFSHAISLAAGLDLPFDSRLTSTAAFGSMRQNKRLLPYSVSALGGDVSANGDGLNWNDPNKLPRKRADAEMRTFRIDLDYVINPIGPMNLRSFVRYYKLDNMTTTADWRYVTQDVAGTNGDVNYRNYRRNLAYAYDKLKFGFDLRHYFSFWRTTLGVGYARESISRDFREANTGENILDASVRTRPFAGLSLSGAYLYGDRTGSDYNYNVTSQSYWYPFALGASDVDNPQFLFANHPDLRKYDVSDRKRNELKLAGTFLVLEDLDVSASYRYRKDDFDSNVEPVAPFAGTLVPLPNPADANALTPGQQLGLLADNRRNITFNVQYIPAEHWILTVFADREEITSSQRGMVFNENQRREPSNATIQTPTQLGPWTDPSRLYEGVTDEVTNTVGLGLGYEIIPTNLLLTIDFSLSRAKMNLDYGGYGSDASYLGRDWETFQFGFNDPGTVSFDQYVFNASLEYRLFESVRLGLHYLYNSYQIRDWIQDPSGPWVEQVGSEFYLRDTSEDNRWGNRLVSLGSYLAPSFAAHVGFVTVTFGF